MQNIVVNIGLDDKCIILRIKLQFFQFQQHKIDQNAMRPYSLQNATCSHLSSAERNSGNKLEVEQEKSNAFSDVLCVIVSDAVLFLCLAIIFVF